MGVSLNATAKSEGASSELDGLGELLAEYGVDLVALFGELARGPLVLLVECVPPLRGNVSVDVLLVVLLHLVDDALLHLVTARRVHRPVPVSGLVMRGRRVVGIKVLAQARGPVPRFEHHHDLLLASELGTARRVEVVCALAHGLQGVLGRGYGQLLVLVLPRGQSHLQVVWRREVLLLWHPCRVDVKVASTLLLLQQGLLWLILRLGALRRVVREELIEECDSVTHE